MNDNWQQEVLTYLKQIAEALTTRKTQRVSAEVPAVVEGSLKELFKAYPKPGGRALATKAFATLVRGHRDPESFFKRFSAAFHAYLKWNKTRGTEPQFYKNLPTWVRDWESWEPKKPEATQSQMPFKARI